jgi:hypothetical protein
VFVISLKPDCRGFSQRFKDRGLDRSVRFCGVLWKVLSWGAVKASLGEMRASKAFEDYICLLNGTDLVVAVKSDGGWLVETGYAGTCIAHFLSVTGWAFPAFVWGMLLTHC